MQIIMNSILPDAIVQQYRIATVTMQIILIHWMTVYLKYLPLTTTDIVTIKMKLGGTRS